MTKIKLTILMVALVLVQSPARAQLEISNYKGWVISVLDGDTVRVLDGSNRMTRVRLKGIDAPEKKQPFGEESHRHLASLLVGKEVKVEAKSKDDHGNILGQIWVEPPDCEECGNTLDANLAQLRAGMAWWTFQFANKQSRDDRKDYEAAEKKARQRALGLWSRPEPIPPWDWRDKEGFEDPGARE